MHLPTFDYQPLGRVICEAGGIRRLGQVCRDLGGTRVLLVTDPGLEHAGHPQRAEGSLRESGIEVSVFDAVRENPSDREVAVGAAAARSHAADLIVAVGGGSAMDCAKGINFVYTNGGKMADYVGHGKATKPMRPSVGIPTTSGTGSEAQSFALITDDSTHVKMACGDVKAAFRVSILDPELTVTQPRFVTAATGIDALAHAVESFVCTKANPVSRAFSRIAFENLEPNFERVLAEPGDVKARAAMQIGAYFAGSAIEASMLGVCHSCANPLTAHYGLTHGVAIGIMLPHVVRYNAAVADPCYRALFGGADRLADRLGGFVHTAGLPTRLKDCGVTASILPVLADEASRQWTARFNPRPPTESDILELYQAAL
ncbi:MAG TPA: iron-containing alcohol dehydrogenase [Fimbriiglobus sp.]|jgi:alcohol dehydrogenase